MQQTFIRADNKWHINSYDGPIKSYIACYVTGVHLSYEGEGVSIIYGGSASSITLLRYYTNVVNYIPSEIFIKFPNMEHFYIYYDDQQFSILKPHYLKNANNLKVIGINKQKKFTNLDANVFIEAPNLEHINLQDNALTSIHKSAFNGLPNLLGVYLANNKINFLHHFTFSQLLNLQVLDLLTNNCISKKYEYANQQVTIIKSELKESCSCHLFDEDLAIENARIEKEKTQQLLAATIKNLQKSHQDSMNQLKDDNLKELVKLAKQNYIDLAKTEEEKFQQSALIKNLTSTIEVLKENDKRSCTFFQEALSMEFAKFSDKIRKDLAIEKASIKEEKLIEAKKMSQLMIEVSKLSAQIDVLTKKTKEQLVNN